VLPSISAAILPIDRALVVALALLLMLAASPASAQAQWNQYNTPAWGRYVAPPWGQYNNRIGANGWRYNQTLKFNEAEGALLNPNQMGPNGGVPPSLFAQPDTRLLGRNAP
jgi:spermidine/putrescine-binding protein